MLVFILLWKVIVTELMADPTPAVSLPPYEYLELRNVSPEPVQMEGWTLRCGKTEKTFPPCVIRPHGFLLVCSVEASPWFAPYGEACPLWTSGTTLANGVGRIVLLDPSGTERHVFEYDLSWYRDTKKKNGGWSLERVPEVSDEETLLLENVQDDAAVWRASADPSGGTPGGVCSWLAGVPGTAVTLTAEPDPVTPDGDGWDDEVRIRYTLPSADWRFDLLIFDRQGAPVRRLAHDDIALPDGSLVWDGRDAAGRGVPTGVYVILFRAYHVSGQVVARKTVVTVKEQ